MPHWKVFIEKDFIGAWTLLDQKTGKPREVTVEIASAGGEHLKTRENPKGKGKLVIGFKGQKKKMVVNTTNAETIASMYGDDVSGWIGKKITLYVGSARNPSGGAAVPAIRVRTRASSAPAESLPDDAPVNEDMRRAQDEAFGRGEREPGEEG